MGVEKDQAAFSQPIRSAWESRSGSGRRHRRNPSSVRMITMLVRASRDGHRPTPWQTTDVWRDGSISPR